MPVGFDCFFADVGCKQNRPKKASRFFGFVFIGQSKNRLEKIGSRSGKTDENRPEKTTFGFRLITLPVFGMRVPLINDGIR